MRALAQAPAAADVIAFLLGLRDQGVFAPGEAVIKLNGRWSVNEVARVGSGHYRAQHKDGVLRIEARSRAEAACRFEVRYVMRTAGLLESTEIWTLDFSKARLSVERKPTGPLRGIGLRVEGKDAFCFTSNMRANACIDNQLFDDHTPNGDDADLDRKAAELEAVVAGLASAGCGGQPASAEGAKQ